MITRLLVLGLLSLRPMSGYTMQQYLALNQTEQWAGVLPGSIYHALKKLEAERLVTLLTTERTGNRLRAIYGVTPTGLEEFRRLLREAWSAPGLHFPVNLYTAMNFLEALPREEITAALDTHIAKLQEEIEVWNAGEEAKLGNLPPALHNYVRLSFTNGREHMETDLRLLRSLRELIPTLPHLAFEPPISDQEQDS
jgi:DNA-binding PadR family transcriptional regulator